MCDPLPGFHRAWRLKCINKAGGPMISTSSKYVILLADDDALVRNVVRTMLTEAGYMVLDAVDGEHALEVSRKYDGAIHALLTDVKMPRMNGLELSTHIIRERPEIKVLVMSGKTSGEMLVIGESVQFLRKPFLPKALRAKLSGLLPDGNV
jgi:two-component system cell cycle sensor histidine kinase/response regulator CckA